MRAAILVGSLLLTACSTTNLLDPTPVVRSTVETFSTLPPTGSGRTIAILPGKAEDRDTLEFRTYADRLAAHLHNKRYEVVPASADARPDYVALFAYGIDNGQLVSETYAIPHWGVTGYSGATTSGNVLSYGNYATYNATTTLSPQYGITGFSNGVKTSQVFTRAIVLDIYDTSLIPASESGSIARAQVYHSKLVSSGTCGSINAVLETLLDAMFKDFPRPSGGTRQIDTPLKGKC